jgi:ferrous iron transport protein B
MAMLELSGYMSRVAFVLDGFFRAFGLSGKSLIPMIVSCGCTVTGLMATRTIEDKSERRMTVFLTPFMPCGAKTAVFGWFSYEFFGGSALIAASMYFLALFSVGVFGFILKRFKAFRSSNGAFILEMPILRAPRIKDVLLILWEKVKDFVLKAGSIVFLVSVALWLLMNFGFNGYNAGNVEQSFLCFIGNAIKFIFYPLGFGNWQASVSVLSGIFAKEAVVETLRQVTENPETLFYNGFSVYAFMTFVLLSPPCMASIATAKGELVSKKWLLGMLFFQFTAGYAIALSVNIIGFIISSATGLIFLSITVIILTTILAITLIKVKGGCAGCAKCLNGERKCHENKKRSTI